MTGLLKKLLPLGIFIGLAACVGQVDEVHLARMNGMMGMSERQLIDAWGTPDKSYVMDDRTKVVTYNRSTNYYTNGGFGTSGCVGSIPGMGVGYSTCVGTPAGHLRHYYCDVTFEIVQGRIRRWGQEGNDCPRIK